MTNMSNEQPTSVNDLPAFLRLPAVIRITGLGRSTIYRMVAEKKFPTPIQLGARAIAWRKADVDQWSHSRPLAKH